MDAKKDDVMNVEENKSTVSGCNLKPGRTDGRNSKHYSGGNKSVYKSVKDQIEKILQENRDKGASKDKKVGYETQVKRSTVMLRHTMALYSCHSNSSVTLFLRISRCAQTQLGSVRTTSEGTTGGNSRNSRAESSNPSGSG